MIEFSNVSKVYPNGVVGLDDVNLTIEQGEFVGIIGLSGAGKSTLLRTINRMHDITSGTLTVDGQEVKNLKGKQLRKFRRNIGMMFQSFNLVTRTTVIRNVLMAKVPEMPFWRVLLGIFKKEDKLNALEALDKVGILDKAYIRADQLSGGQQQRVALARAIVIEPEVLLMDEPLSNLDAKLRNQMRAELIKLRHEIKGTFIYVTHDQTEAMTLGDRIVVMKDGVVQQIATPQEVFNHPANIFVAGFIGVPQMNFFDAQLVRSGNGFTVKTEDMNVALAPETCAQLALNWDGGDVKEITAGVRPEQILLADKGEEGALQGTVEVTELMGSTEHVHVTAPNGQFVLIIPVVDLEAKGALKAGDTIWFKFEKNATHLFDKVSGKNLI